MKLPVEFYREAADTVTYGRIMATGAVLGSLVTAPKNDQHSWGRSMAYSVTGMADGLDGRIVRLHPNGPTAHGATLDEQSDKVASYATEATLAIKHQDPFAAVSVAVDLVRDSFVHRKRNQLRAAGLDAKSRPLGKTKTFWKFATNSLAFSPLAEKHPNLIRGMRIGGMLLSVVSGFDIMRSANCAISQQDFLVQKSKTK